MTSFLVVKLPQGHDTSYFVDSATNKGLAFSLCHKSADFTKFLDEGNGSEAAPKRPIEDSITVKIEEGASINLADLRAPGATTSSDDVLGIDGEDSEQLVIRGGKVTYEGGELPSSSENSGVKEEPTASISRIPDEEDDLDLGSLKRSANWKPSNFKLFVCPVCQRTLNTKNSFEGHMRTHTGEKPYGCWDCGMRFADANRLRLHRRTQHIFKTTIECDQCKQRFRTETALQNHKKCVHWSLTPRRHLCKFCEFGCALEQTLLNHVQKEHAAKANR